MQKVISISSFSRSRLDQDPIKGSYYGWHSQFARHLVGHMDAVIESWSIDAALSLPQSYEREGVTYRLFPSGFFLSPGRELSLQLLSALKHEAREHDIVVHLHDYHNWQSYAIALSVNAPVVAHYHGATHRPIANLHMPRRWFAAPLFLIEQLFENIAMKKMCHFFLVNPRDKETYERCSLPYSFCPMAPEPDAFLPMVRTEARKTLGISERTKALLNVGGFAPVKNLELLVSTFADLRRKTDATLYILGPTYSKKYAARISLLIKARHLDGAIKVIGMVPRVKLNLYYNAADALVVTSTAGEGGPTVILESLAVGLPVVSTAVGFTRDILPKAQGLLTVVESDAALVPELARVLTSVTSQRVVCRPWTWGDVIQVVTAVYTSIVPRSDTNA